MKLTRREMLRGGLSALGFLALPGGLFAAPAGWKPKKKSKLEVSLDRIDKIDRIDNRGKAANGKNPVNPVNPVKKGPGLRVKIPLADGNPDSLVFAYDVVVVGDDPRIIQPTYNHNAAGSRVSKLTLFPFPIPVPHSSLFPLPSSLFPIPHSPFPMKKLVKTSWLHPLAFWYNSGTRA